MMGATPQAEGLVRVRAEVWIHTPALPAKGSLPTNDPCGKATARRRGVRGTSGLAPDSIGPAASSELSSWRKSGFGGAVILWAHPFRAESVRYRIDRSHYMDGEDDRADRQCVVPALAPMFGQRTSSAPRLGTQLLPTRRYPLSHSQPLPK